MRVEGLFRSVFLKSVASLGRFIERTGTEFVDLLYAGLEVEYGDH